MQNSPYNNPMLAQGLSSLVQSFIGNPQAEGQAQEAASRALLNNQTAQFRDAIGETGLGGDLAAMMIRSLQAGPDYARAAPGIGDNALRFGAMGFGRPELTPQGDIAGMIVSAMQPRSGGRSSGGGGAGAPQPAGQSWASLTQGERNRVQSLLRNSGLNDQDQIQALNAIIQQYESGAFGSADQAAASLLPNIKREPVQVGVDPNDSWYNPLDWFRGPSPIMEEQLVIPGITAPAPTMPQTTSRLRWNPKTGDFE